MYTLRRVHQDLAEYLKTFISVLMIVNPIGAIPVFIAITAGDPPEKQRKQAKIASMSVAIILIVAAWAGAPLLSLFGIGIPAFRVGGGVLILLMAISMMYAKPTGLRQTSAEQAEAVTKENVAVVPLAIPLMAGPGAISTAVLTADRVRNWVDMLALHVGAALIGAVVFLALRAALPISRAMGRTGINVATRLMGMILAAVSIEFIASGASALFPGLAGSPPAP